MMKTKVLFLSLIWLLSACAPATTREPTQTTVLTPTKLPTLPLTPTITRTKALTRTSTLTPTEIPATILSMDPENPTKMTLAEFSAAKFTTHKFSPEAKLTPGTYFLVHQEPDWSTLFLYRDKYLDPKTQPLAVNGFMDVTMPDGTVIFVVQESILNSDGTISEWNIGWNKADFTNPPLITNAKVNFDFKRWIRLLLSGTKYFVPQGKKSDPIACMGWNSPYVCEHTIPEMAEMVEDFVYTGISDPRLSEGFLIPNNEVWDN